MIVIKLLLFLSLFCATLGSSWNNFEDYLRSLPGREISEENNEDSSELKFYRHLTQERNIKENDQLNNHVQYSFKRPTKNKKHIDDSDSFDWSSSDSSEENVVQNIRNLSNNYNKQLSQDYHDLESIGHKKTKQSRSSKGFEGEIFNFYKKDSRKNKSKLQSSTSVENANEVDIQRLIKESILKRWKELDITVKLLLIDNYRFTRTTLLQEIMTNDKYKTRDISRLEKKLLQLYYTLKRDILQTVKLSKIQFRREVSKQKLKRQQVYDVEQLYIAKLKEQINTKIIIFKQNVVLVIEQFHLELKPVTDYTTTEATTTREPTTEIPFDPVYESTSVPNHTTTALSTTNISAIGHVTIENIPLSISTLTEVDNTDEEEAPILMSAHRHHTEVATASDHRLNKTTYRTAGSIVTTRTALSTSDHPNVTTFQGYNKQENTTRDHHGQTTRLANQDYRSTGAISAAHFTNSSRQKISRTWQTTNTAALKQQSTETTSTAQSTTSYPSNNITQRYSTEVTTAHIDHLTESTDTFHVSSNNLTEILTQDINIQPKHVAHFTHNYPKEINAQEYNAEESSRHDHNSIASKDATH